ncbi:MAG: hypothetical protein GKR94_09710 [Gammaproteobacteria bacterium]|nr:hypothetical protein [Gammaproteobacteria bacterium]
MHVDVIPDWVTLVIAISGWVMTALGLVSAAIQTYRVEKLEKRNREQLEMFIEDADYVSFEHEIIDEIARKLDDPMILRFLVASHQRGCDLYRSLVDFYLSSESKFTYEDLRRVCQTPMISYRWQEDFWLGRVAMRPENRSKEVPAERVLKENRNRRFRAIQQRDVDGGSLPDDRLDESTRQA